MLPKAGYVLIISLFLMDLSGISKLPERYGRRVRIKAVCVQEFRAVWICL